MYRLKNIVQFDNEVILPECMYSLKKITIPLNVDETELNISNQEASTTKMTELEERQGALLKKLDILYERIQTISSYCKLNCNSTILPKRENNSLSYAPSEDIVIVLGPDSLPWFLNFFLRKQRDINIIWHIHSSVQSQKRTKIQEFFKRYVHLYPGTNTKINLRLIFKCVAADSELKLSPLEIPIIGTVNVLRYLAMVYPNVVSYNFSDYQVDSLLDLCYLLERSPEKNKEMLIKKLFSQYHNWIYDNYFSIVDLAVYNIVKQWQNSMKYIPKLWFENCEKLLI